MQYALAKYMTEPSRYMYLNDFYQKKRDLFCEGLKNTPFKFIPAQGSFFQMVSYGHLSEESDYDLAVRLTKTIGVASIPVSVFYHDQKDHKMLRFCFAKNDDVLEQALDLLSRPLF
jgi:methionine aminotransferase